MQMQGHLHGTGQRRKTVLLHLADQGDVDVGQDTSTSDGGLDELIELIVGTDGEKQVTRVDTLNVHILGGVTSKLEQLGSQVLKDGSGVDGSSSSDTASGVGTLLQETMDTSDGELGERKKKGTRSSEGQFSTHKICNAKISPKPNHRRNAGRLRDRSRKHAIKG